MLRIIQAQTEAEQQWTLCGQLTGPWVAELRMCWEQCRRNSEATQTVVDLSDVTFIDESGEKLLSDMRNAGVTFIAAGVETKYLLDNLKAKGDRPLRRFIGPLTKRCEDKSAIENGRNK
jgi:ABC-type transporter Mla MlaB component